MSEKRKFKRIWHSNRPPEDQRRLNKTTVKLTKPFLASKLLFSKIFRNLLPKQFLPFALRDDGHVVLQIRQMCLLSTCLKYLNLIVQLRRIRNHRLPTIFFPDVPSYRTFYSCRDERYDSASQFQKNTEARQNY